MTSFEKIMPGAPRAMWAAGGLRRQVPADAAASQLSKTCASALPLPPGDRTESPPGPLLLRPRYCLMCRAPRPEAEAVLGECPVPIRLQHLHHRLLNEASRAVVCRSLPSVSTRRTGCGL